MSTTIRPFLMFQGKAKAEEAINFYVSLFPNARVDDMVRYGKEGPGPEGSVMKATFTIAGQSVLCTDSFVEHKFGFTPSFSFFVECESAEQLERVFAALSEGGEVLMELANYGFSQRFGWVNDRFGVSWQVNLA